ncbi:MAG: polyphenol oxidase family protein [Pseudomonadota bacterium]
MAVTPPPFACSELLSAPHGFFGRQGGVSQGTLASLNGSFASGDDHDAVQENRRRVSAALGAADILTAKQIHSDIAVFVSEPFTFENRPEADALVTDVPGLALGALAADCTPILLEADGLVAALHAGWRGSLAGVIESAVRLMAAHGAARKRIKAAIGPCLRRESFEVREDLITAVTAKHPDAACHFTDIGSGQSLYDHTSFVIDRLKDAGLAAHHISDVGGDTLTQNDRYFSYRDANRQGFQRFGRNLSVIVTPA